MKKLILVIILAAGIFQASAQKDTSLQARLDKFLAVNQALDFEKVLDFTYPKLFDVVPRYQMLDILKNSFNNEEMSIRLDSLRIVRIFPVFSSGSSQYAKVSYSMNMYMKFKESPDSMDASDEKEYVDMLLSTFNETFGKENVSYVAGTKELKVKQVSDMVAIRDSTFNWTFINLEEDSQGIMDRLLSKEVQAKLAAYK